MIHAGPALIKKLGCCHPGVVQFRVWPCWKNLLKRALIGIGTFILLVVVGITAYLMLADFSSYKTDIEQAIADATGREARIEGDFILEAVPPSIVVEGLSFDNAEWGSEPLALSVGHFSARIDGSSIFSGPLVIEEVRLRDVDVLIEKNADGDGNWSIEQQEDNVAVDVQVDEGDETEVVLQLAGLENIRVTQRAPGVDDRVIFVESFAVTTSDDDYLVATGTGSLDDQAMNLDARIGPTSNLGDGRNLDVTVEADLGILVANVQGNTGNPATLDGTEFDLDVTSDDVTAIVDLLELPIEATGALQINGQVAASETGPRLSFDASLMDIEAGGSVVMDGDRITVDLTASSLSGLGTIAGVSDLPPGPVTASGDVRMSDNAFGLIDFTVAAADLEINSNVSATIDGDRVQLDPFSFVIGDSDLSGELDITTSDPMRVSGEIRSKLLDLTPFTPEETVEETPPEDAGEFVLSEEPLPFDFLNAGAVDLTIGIDDFRNGPIRLQDVNTAIKLEDGVLQQESSFSVADGGSATSKVELAAAGDSATLDMEFDIADLKLRLGQAGERSAAEIPSVGLTADIESRGNSVHSLAAAANGKVIFTQGPGIVNNEALGVFSADIVTELLSALNPFAKNEPYSVWDCTVVGMNIVDGVATMNPVLAQSEKVTIVADGSVDFNDESLDLSFNTKPRSGVGVSADMFLTPFIRLGGTMASPRLALDKSGVLLEGGAAFLTGGISFLVKGAADRASGAQDRCAAALAIAEGREVESEE